MSNSDVVLMINIRKKVYELLNRIEEITSNLNSLCFIRITLLKFSTYEQMQVLRFFLFHFLLIMAMTCFLLKSHVFAKHLPKQSTVSLTSTI